MEAIRIESRCGSRAAIPFEAGLRVTIDWHRGSSRSKEIL